jgi:transposase
MAVSAAEIEAIVAPLHAAIAELTALVRDLRDQLAKKDAENAQLKRLVFGKRSERLPPRARETKRARDAEMGPAEREAKRIATKAKRGARAKAKRALPTRDVVHDISSCPHCASSDLKPLGTSEVASEIEFIPAHFIRTQHIRPKKRCNGCARIVTAPSPARVVDGGHYASSVYAHLAVAKCADAIPLHRLSARFARDGFDVTRSTMNTLFHRTAELLGPIAARVLALIRERQHVHADETPIRIQAKDVCRRGFIWTFLADELVAFVFSASRSGETPKAVLDGSSGTLQVDAYSGYNVVVGPGGRTRVGCLAHMRRDFFQARATAEADADEAMRRILLLYDVEYEAARRDILGTAQHLSLRRTGMREHFDAMRVWMDERRAHHLPKSPMGAALAYALKHWASLEAVFADANIPLDNNLAEGALRIIALGRKNFLFVGDDEAGENLAVLQTIVATCQASDVNPETYIADVLLRVADTPASEIDSLLPANWKPAAQDIALARVN